MKYKKGRKTITKQRDNYLVSVFLYVYMILVGFLEPVDTDYSGRGLRGWLGALSWATVHISALL